MRFVVLVFCLLAVTACDERITQPTSPLNSEFTLPVDLRGAGGNFDTIAELEQSGGSASATLNDLKPGSSYEWYVTVTDCAHTVSSPVYRFTTPP